MGVNGVPVSVIHEEDELVEKEIRDRFKKMCEGYFDNVSKKLLIEHKVGRYEVRTASQSPTSCTICSVYKNKIVEITKHISSQEKYLKIVNKLTRKWQRHMRSC